MKLFLSSAILLGLFSGALAGLSATTVSEQEAEIAQAKNELGKKKKKDQLGWHQTVQVSFKLEHFKVQDEDDTDTLSKKLFGGAFQGSFEEVFEGMTSNWGFVDSLVEVPEPEDPNRLGTTRRNTRRIYYGTYSIDASCRLCPPDLLARGKKGGESFSNFLKDTKKWSEVGEHVCSKLRALGIDDYSEIECDGFSVGYLSAEEDDLMEQITKINHRDTALAASSGTAQAQIMMHHVRPNGNSNIEAIQKALALAYENVFEDTGMSIDSVELLRQVNVPEKVLGEDSVVVNDIEISVTNDNGSDGDEYEMSMYWINLGWSCEDDDCTAHDLIPGLVQKLPKTTLYSIFESYVCYNLRESGEAAFEDATGCSILFEI